MTTPVSRSTIHSFVQNISQQPKAVKVALGVLGAALAGLTVLSGYIVYQAWYEKEEK